MERSGRGLLNAGGPPSCVAISALVLTALARVCKPHSGSLPQMSAEDMQALFQASTLHALRNQVAAAN
jgi:hypothetical protein